MDLSAIYYGNSVQTWAIALFIIVGAYVGGKVTYWILGNIIKRITRKTKTKLDDILIDMIEEPIMLAIILGGTWYAFTTLTLSPWWDDFIGKAFRVAIIMNIAWLISRLVEAVFREYLIPLVEKTENDLDDQLLPVARKGVKFIIWTLAIIIALDNAGYNVGALLAGLGIGGLALAMAAKDTVGNIFGGFTIYSDQPFKIKDRVRVKGFDGTIKEIGIRSTRIKTLAGTEVIIPNSTFTDNPVENVTREPSRKVVLKLGLTYDTTPAKMELAQKLLQQLAKKNKNINADYKMAFTEFGDFSLGILFIYYIKKGKDILQTQNEMNMNILKEFNKNKLEFAFPTQTIFHKKI